MNGGGGHHHGQIAVQVPKGLGLQAGVGVLANVGSGVGLGLLHTQWGGLLGVVDRVLQLVDGGVDVLGGAHQVLLLIAGGGNVLFGIDWGLL